MAATPVRRVPVGAPEVLLERRADGSTLLRSPEPLAAYPSKLTERFAHWAREAPDRVFIAERDPSGAWRKLSYGEAFARFRAIAQALLDRELAPERPVVILSDNDVEQALLALAAMHVGIPFAPVSSAYSLVSTDFEKLRYVVELLTPGLVFAADAAKFGKAIDAVVPAGTEVVVTRGEIPGRADDAVRRARGRPRDRGGRPGARRGRSRHDREVPADVGLDRPSEGGDQHAAHALLEPCR